MQDFFVCRSKLQYRIQIVIFLESNCKTQSELLYHLNGFMVGYKKVLLFTISFELLKSKINSVIIKHIEESLFIEDSYYDK